MGTALDLPFIAFTHLHSLGGVLGLGISLRLRLPDDDFTLSLLLLLALQGVRSDRTVGAELP